MLRDQRSEHRISALWALRQIGWWQLINEVGRLAKEDANLRVRRYAMNPAQYRRRNPTGEHARDGTNQQRRAG